MRMDGSTESPTDALRAPRLALLALVLLVLGGCYGSGIGIGGGGRNNDDDDDNGDDDDDSSAGDDDDSTGDDDDDDSTAGDDDDSTNPPEFSITQVTPNDGDTRGGLQTSIYFDGSLANTDESELTVMFGAMVAEDPIITNDRIVVDSPPGCAAGDVDVSVTTVDDGADTMVNGFEYELWADDDDLTSVIGVYYGETPLLQQTSASVEAGFFEPDSSIPLNHLPPVGSCTPNLVTPDNNRAYFNVGSSVTMSGGGSFPLTYNSIEGTYGNASVPAQFAGPGTSFSVFSAMDPDGCAMDLQNVVQAPEALFVTQPSPYDDINTTDCWWMFDQFGTANPVGGLVQWQAPSSAQVGQNVIIQVANSTSGTSLTCHAQDNGAFVVSSTNLLFLDASTGGHTITVSRYLTLESDDTRTGATRFGLYLHSSSGLLWVSQVGPGC